ncbi:MAG: GAP family protein [Gaiellaceae bacterium]
MAALLAIVVAVAAADSLNPSTLGPALLFAVGARPRRDVAAFTLGIFLVSTAGGLALVLGPGAALRGAVPHPTAHVLHLVELAAGGALLAAAAGLWRLRAVIARRLAAGRARSGRSALLLGIGIMAVELPTALPYFAALTAVVASKRALPTQVAFVALYNAVFIAPLLLVFALVALAGPRGTRVATAARARLDRIAPIVLPVVLALIGFALVAFGARGLMRR